MHRILALSCFAVSAFSAETYREIMLADEPVAYWRFDEIQECCTPNETHESLRANAGANVSLITAGPRPPAFPLFAEENTASDFTYFKTETFLRVKDPGPLSVFDFAEGHTITIEAWVSCPTAKPGQTVVVVTKGGTNADGANQNWALGLFAGTSADQTAVVPLFTFHGGGTQFRFSGKRGFLPGTEWHHIAATYSFGDPKSAKLYLNGELVPGEWTSAPPVGISPSPDDDELWIGGAQGGKAELQFPGYIDELAIYRKELPIERLKLRVRRTGSSPTVVDVR